MTVFPNSNFNLHSEYLQNENILPNFDENTNKKELGLSNFSSPPSSSEISSNQKYYEFQTFPNQKTLELDHLDKNVEFNESCNTNNLCQRQNVNNLKTNVLKSIICEKKIL